MKTKINIKIILTTLSFFVLFSNGAFSQKHVLLDNTIDRLSLDSEYFTYIIDESENLQKSEILKGNLDNSFKPFNTKLPWNQSYDKWQWIKIELDVPQKLSKKYVLEFLDFKIQDLELYMPNNTYNHGYATFYTGMSKPFSQREYEHKNFAFNLHEYQPGNYTIYARVRANEKVNLMVVISQPETFLRYATTEYFMLALFLGMLLITCVASLFIFISIKEVSYLYYSIYVLAVGTYFLCRVGLGFEFIWPNNPEINHILRPISLFVFSAAYILYGTSFLKLPFLTYSKNNILSGLKDVIVLGAIIALDSYLNYREEGFLLAWVPFAYILLKSKNNLKEKSLKNYLVLLGSLFVLLGLVADLLQKYSIIPNNWLGYYAVMFMFAIEMLTLTWAMAIRIRDYVKEQGEIQKRINEELEIKVAQRTIQLEEKKEELDLYALKVSTDIKGPLRSMIASCNMAHQDESIERYRESISQVEKIARNLDKLISEMFRISTLDKSLENNTNVNVKRIFDEIVEKNKKMNNWKNVSFTNELSNEDQLFTNPVLFYLSFQNLIENAISYPKNPGQMIHIKVYGRNHNKGFQIVVEDDTVGIPAHHLIHVLNDAESSHTSGHLGMFVVKNTLSKLGFEIDVFKMKNQGNQFVISPQ
ncbi:MAG: sensor histidine kinase [Bacteroidota bacterium]|nr:sensor histidine kinase [Bacteroidota bacterium]